jgi:ABC-2 type transport system ATP-binding protein
VRGLRERAGQRVALTFAEAPDPRRSPPSPASRRPARGDDAHCLLHGEPDALLKLAARHRVTHWTARDLDLEDLFMDVYRFGPDGVNGANGVRDAR